ncbi:hypothetical protein E2L08_07380 [Palleronia sediminis]|uniref:2-dehydropantoate 2-reductase n=1 Tax=Palleronia sediminis TaxID=2547833 RepID=A0A4V3B9Z6_9RHOB|nr:hypothetical protein [Palleronia sediminis]TDL81149.1 hypothetical protein E2L08_07380 [Palleronia sediminis]
MARKILILGASYGSLLGTKLLMAGHDVTLLCRDATAGLINSKGTDVRIRLRGEDTHRSFRSGDMPGKLDAQTPEAADPAGYDLVCLAMQEPQYGHPAVAALLGRIAAAGVPCMSIMNMPPPPYMRRVEGLDTGSLEDAFSNPRIWDAFDPSLVTLCSPDPQAYRPPEEGANVLHVGLPTNFKVARFDAAGPDAILDELAAGIEELRLDGAEIPVKLRVHDSLFVPFAKWAMLATGNYRCITPGEPIPIREAVTGDLELSREIYGFVDSVVQRLGGAAEDLVPFEKYAAAAESLGNPSSAARAIASGAQAIERVDKLIQRIGRTFDMRHPTLDATVDLVDAKLARNRSAAA